MPNRNSQSRRPTRDDVAKLAGVSPATVSHVVNKGPKWVAEETREKVLKAIKELGYRPDAIARSLKTGRTNTIGLIVPVIASPWMALAASRVQDTMRNKGYSVIMASSHDNPELESKMIDLMASQSIDGLIIAPVSDENRQQLEEFAESNAPVVFMDRFIPDFPADFVITDNVKITQRVTEFLIHQGCRNPVCVIFSESASSATDRLKGFQQGLEASGIVEEKRHSLVLKETTISYMEAEILTYFEQFGMPDGIFCATEEIGIGMLKALNRKGGDLPANRIVIFDAKWAELLTPPLPIVMQDVKTIALTAVELLINRINGEKHPHRQVYVDAHFFLR